MTPPALAIGPGSRADAERLAGHHYASGPPATIARGPGGWPCILAARDEAGLLAGVLVVSMPTLNSAWRRLAWPGEYESGDKRRDARAINRSLRCISRVIVEPRFRGQGVAARLVRAYLDAPLTARTEAVASMGRVCPFFERAGMAPYPLPPTARDARLLDALASVAVEPWELLVEGAAGRVVAAHPWLGREARVWADASGATRRFRDGDASELLMYAGARAAQRPVAYAHGG